MKEEAPTLYLSEGVTERHPLCPMRVFPAHQLSVMGNAAEFSIPDTTFGKAVCGLHLVWGRVEGAIQPCILHPAVRYPGFQPVTADEVYATPTTTML